MEFILFFCFSSIGYFCGLQKQMAEILKVDLSAVSMDVPCVNPAKKEKFEDQWAAARKLLINHSISSFIPQFFPHFVVAEETKWEVLAFLDESLKDTPADKELLLQRAAVRLQCNIPLHAYSDGLNLLGQFNEDSLKDKSSFKFILDANLVCLIAAMLMGDRDLIAEVVIAALTMYFQSDRHMFHLNPNVAIIMTSNMIKALEMGLYEDDHYLEALFVLGNFMDVAATAGTTMLSSQVDVFTPPRIVSLQMHVLLLLQNDLKHRYALLSDRTLGQKIQSHKDVSSSMNKFHMIARMSLSTVRMPQLSRNDPGGDRDPNNVLRTLFSTKRDVMQFVRVVVDHEKGGFKLVAKMDIACNEVYLVEKAVVSFINPIRGISYCEYCLKAIDADSCDCTCMECGETYCNTFCKDSANSLYHRAICKDSGWSTFLKANSFQTASSSFPFTVCLTFKLMVMAELQGKVSVMDIPEVKILANTLDISIHRDKTFNSSNPSLNCSETQVGISKLILAYKMFKAHCPALLTRSSLVDFVTSHCIVKSNSIGQWDATHSMHETRLFVAGSFANHSCDPNTDYFVTSDTAELMFRAMRPIKSGEEITISYVDNNQNYEMRQTALLATYGFHCNCFKCSYEEKDGIAKKTDKGK